MGEGQFPRLSGKEMLILELLGDGGEMYGLQLVRASCGGLARGTVYVTLDRMEDKGFVSSRHERPQPSASGMPRRLYTVTGRGIRTLQAYKWAMTGSGTLDVAEAEV